MLFHGTGHSNIQAICTFNFDWRLTGSHGDVYGKGRAFRVVMLRHLILARLSWLILFPRLQGATSPGMPNTPASSATPRGSTTPRCRDTDSPRRYSPVSPPTKPCSWPECLLESTQSVIPCTADRPPRTPASLTFMTAAWTTWPIQRFTSFLTAIRFTPSTWLSFTKAWIKEACAVFFLNSGWFAQGDNISGSIQRTGWNGKSSGEDGWFFSQCQCSIGLEHDSFKVPLGKLELKKTMQALWTVCLLYCILRRALIVELFLCFTT